MPKVLVAFGANLGDPENTLEQVLERLAQDRRLRVLSASRPHQTQPVGNDDDQPSYTNAAILLEFDAGALELLELLQQVEKDFGRIRDSAGKRWKARPVDLDLILYGQEVISQGTIEVPHPRMSFRRFVLEPAFEVAADQVHPVSGLTIAELLQKLEKKYFFILLATSPEFDLKAIRNRLSETNSNHAVNWSEEILDPKTIENWRRDSEETNESFVFRFQPVRSLEAFRELESMAQLVVLFKSTDTEKPDNAWPWAASKFRGATLELSANGNQQKMAEEIVAACQAMLPTNVAW